MNKFAIAGIGLLTYVISDIRVKSLNADQHCLIITTQHLSDSKLMLAIDCKAGRNSYVDIRINTNTQKLQSLHESRKSNSMIPFDCFTAIK